jgi:acyl-CoA thioesterase
LYEFDQDTALQIEGPGRFRGEITDRWSIGRVPNGGYIMSVALRGLCITFDGLDPLSASCHFLRPCEPGPARVTVETHKKGRSFSAGSARLIQGGTERAVLLATFGDLSRVRDLPRPVVDGSPPVILESDEAEVDRPAFQPPAIAGRLDLRMLPETAAFMRGERGDPELRGRVRFRDGRDPCVLSLALFADALPPPVFNAVEVGWAPTLELGVQFRARPAAGWLRCTFRTRFAFGGMLEEDGELWDDEGQLVALSRQLALLPRPSQVG